jgi:hypothetical protein
LGINKKTSSLAQKLSALPETEVTTLNFEISDLNGNSLSCQCTEADAVATILALLSFQGDELMLDTDDWREYDWHTGKDTYTAREIVENDLDSTGVEVHFETYTDISSLVTSGAWIVKDDHAYCIAHWPSGKARKHCKRRGDFTQARKLHPVWLDKLKQLESLGH